MESGVPKYFLLTLLIMVMLLLVIPAMLLDYQSDLLIVLMYSSWIFVSTWIVEKLESVLYKDKDRTVDR